MPVFIYVAIKPMMPRRYHGYDFHQLRYHVSAAITIMPFIYNPLAMFIPLIYHYVY